ncbi:nucleotidyltransferase family protein [Aurantiacibacter marinus]|uniref:Nucleotidyltransferase family protein n=1 Tax=Aurantiacibacter marinus TaxID=874156 RepID=A0A0H0XQJ9_9SPHN|nr:nucleotidyltransferase family protein [Aurantiacibacter marinus]KLI64624.1 hypothetical protein AAV99_03455 [Aurantiacibacter marinus]
MARAPHRFDDFDHDLEFQGGPDSRTFLRDAMLGAATWPSTENLESDGARLWPIIQFHGCALAIAQHRGSLAGWPEALAGRIRDEARLQAVWEATHKAALKKLLSAMADADLELLVIKGTAIAYDVFPDPALRRRGDTDLLARPRDANAVRQVLRELDCQRVAQMSLQEDWRFPPQAGFHHLFDLHWQASSAPGLRGLYEAEEAFLRSVKLPGLSDQARATDPVLTFMSDALNQAMHSVAGYLVDGEVKRGGHRLIWSYGTYLQASRFTDTQWSQLRDLCCERGLAQICLRSLDRAEDDFGTCVPESIRAALVREGDSGEIDRFVLHAGTWERFRFNFGHAANWAQRVDVLRANLFSNEDFLRRKYPDMASMPLALLRLRRLSQAPLSLVKSITGRRSA